MNVAPRSVQAERARAILAKMGVVAGLVGCSGGQLSPQAQRAADTFECYVRVVKPHVGEVIDAAELVRDAIQGRTNLPQVLASLGATADTLRTVEGELRACQGPPEAPPVNPRTLAFGEPTEDL